MKINPGSGIGVEPLKLEDEHFDELEKIIARDLNANHREQISRLVHRFQENCSMEENAANFGDVKKRLEKLQNSANKLHQQLNSLFSSNNKKKQLPIEELNKEDTISQVVLSKIDAEFEVYDSRYSEIRDTQEAASYIAFIKIAIEDAIVSLESDFGETRGHNNDKALETLIYKCASLFEELELEPTAWYNPSIQNNESKFTRFVGKIYYWLPKEYQKKKTPSALNPMIKRTLEKLKILRKT